MSDPSDDGRGPTPLQRFDALPRRRVPIAGGHHLSIVDTGGPGVGQPIHQVSLPTRATA